MKRIFWGLLILTALVVSGCGKSVSEPLDGTATVQPTNTSQSGNNGTSPRIETFTLATTATSLIAAPGNVNKVMLTATMVDDKGVGIAGQTVNFSASQGTLSATSAITNTYGEAKVFLSSTARPAVSYVTAIEETSLSFAEKFISFTPGPATAAKSSIIAEPATIPADGTSTSTITVTLLDANSIPVADGTSVTLTAPAGTLAKPTATTTSGRAVFTLTAGTKPPQDGVVYLSTSNLSGLTGTLVMGSGAVGKPANIDLSVSEPHIFVAGVGQTENTHISVSILDAAGNPIDDAGLTEDNLKITWISHPWGGESLTDGLTVNPLDNDTTTMSTRTVGGAAALYLQSGTLPGTIEVEIEVLDVGGASLNPPVKARLPQVVIASGPPHTIVITHPLTNAIANLGGGVYQLKGTAIVTDRFGNAVPDGTAIHFGLIDSVIAHGLDGATTAGSPNLTAAINFSTASIVRNALTRTIQANDRVLIKETGVSDRSHYVTLAEDGSLTTSRPYQESRTAREFWVGASLLGAHINGCREWASGQISNLHDSCKEFATGEGITKQGLVPFWMVYPAKKGTIMTGTNPALDTRVLPLGSGKVILVASSTDTSTTTLDMNYYFAPVSPFTIEAVPDQISSSQDIVLTVRDATAANGGDSIPVPFIPVSWSFVPAQGTDPGGINVAVTIDSALMDPNGVLQTDSYGFPLTDFNGQVVVNVVISGTGASAPGILTFYSEKGKVEVKVYHP